MNIGQWKIGDVKPYENNPRINDAAVHAVARSIQEFGFRQPVVVDEAGVIIVGHTRHRAAEKLGLETVPVHVAKGLSPEQVKAYRLADNKTAELAEWDYELLPLELSQLREMEYDLDLVGFTEDELAEILDPDVQEGLTDPDVIPEPPDAAITQPGDLWILGNHRLLCGDSSKPEDVDLLLDGAQIHLCNTDPPYGVKHEPRSNNAIAAGLSAHQFFGPNNAVDVWSIKKVNPQSMVHLTEKPVDLAVRAIQYSSRAGENVLDLFGGSGSTLIGCEQTDRNAFLMELDPPYCDVIVERWEKFTGKKAERISAKQKATA